MVMRQRCDLHATCNGRKALHVAVQTVRQPFRYPFDTVAQGLPRQAATMSARHQDRVRFVHMSCSSSDHCWRCGEVVSEPGTH